MARASQGVQAALAQRRRVPLPQLTTVEAPGGKRPWADPADLQVSLTLGVNPTLTRAGRERDLVVSVGPSVS